MATSIRKKSASKVAPRKKSTTSKKSTASKKTSAKKTSTGKKTATRKTATSRKKTTAGKTKKASPARKYSRKASSQVGRELHEMKRGKLKSGSGKKVTSRKQAIAIGLSEARRSGEKVPPNPEGGSSN